MDRCDSKYAHMISIVVIWLGLSTSFSGPRATLRSFEPCQARAAGSPGGRWPGLPEWPNGRPWRDWRTWKGRDWSGERLRDGLISTSCGGTTASSEEQFFQAAGLAREFEYWNAAVLLYIHSAIALADAVAIVRRGQKSASEGHMDALALLEEALENVKGKNEATENMRRLIDEKTRVSHMGISIRRADLGKMETPADRFRVFAQRMPGEA